MGSQCLATTPNQKYNRYLGHIKVSELKDLWQTVKVYKMKTIFEEHQEQNPYVANQTYLPYKKFKPIFPQLHIYPEQQIRRIYDFFDIESEGFVDWNSFFSALTICYFASETDLAVIMFMIFDNSLEFQLDQEHLKLMLQTNEAFLKEDLNDVPRDCEDVISELKATQGIDLDRWIKQAHKYIEFSKFRNVFNIFLEEQMEKELVKHFNSWNTIFNLEKQKYVGYLINLKWFESWKLYIQNHYGVNINIYNTELQTVNTIKTCKKTTFKSLKNVTRTALESSTEPHGCRPMIGKGKKDKKSSSNVKDYDCIHGHLGERPREIANEILQGQFQEVLRGDMSQNMDYVVVSEQVWKHLKTVYGGHPQFRRTGFDSIELYPKVVSLYFSLFKGSIDYSTQVLREVSSYLSVEQMLTKSCDVSAQDIEKKVIFYKTIGMKRWQLIDDPSYLFTELSSDIFIFLVCLPVQEKQTFLKSHQKHPRDPTDVNLGDLLTYVDSNKQQHCVVFMGKSTQGKYILHFKGQSYYNDLCLMQPQMLKHCKLAAELQSIEPEKKVHSGLVGLPNGPGIGFINTVFIQLFNNKEVRKVLSIADSKRDDKFFYNLGKVYSLWSKQCKVEISDLKLLVQIYLNQYADFEVSMCKNVIGDICKLLTSEFKEQKLSDVLEKQYGLQVQKKINCTHCKNQSTNKQSNYFYSVMLPEQQFYCLQVVWVPLYTTATDILKFIVKVKKDATMGQLIKAIQYQLGANERPFVLAQVHSHDIVKNYHFAKQTATLQALKIRQGDKLYAYELATNFNSFVHSHFSNRQLIQEDEIKKDMFIDCKHEERGWILGKVIQLDFLPYTQASFVRVMHKFNKNQSWQITYNCFEEVVARFPLKSHKNSEQYHLKVQQRCFNQAANSMQLVSTPLVLTLPAWMRWKQFFFFVYLQVKRFIADSYSFDLETAEPNTGRKQTTKGKGGGTAADKFKEYRNGSRFPYVLRLADCEGRCIICLKFLKSTVFKGENGNYCQGCDLSQSEPISWQVKPADLVVCVDWKSNNRFRRDVIANSQSANARITQLQKQQSYCLTTCMAKMKNEYIQRQQQWCCNVSADKKIKEKIMKSSDSLVIYIERIVQEEDGFKKVLNRPMKMVIEGLQIQGKKYNLSGMTSIQGQNLNIRYRTYVIKGKGQWYEYDGQLVRVVSTAHLQKQCALVLYYQKADK